MPCTSSCSYPCKRRCARVKTARLFALLFSLPVWQQAATVLGRCCCAAWNQAAAAHYLDSRETWWQSWDAAKRDHETVCVSCHTVLPYALSRSSLRGPLGEGAPTEQEHIMLNNVLRRSHVERGSALLSQQQSWSHAATDSRATESVLNALILSTTTVQKNHI